MSVLSLIGMVTLFVYTVRNFHFPLQSMSHIFKGKARSWTIRIQITNDCSKKHLGLVVLNYDIVS